MGNQVFSFDQCCSSKGFYDEINTLRRSEIHIKSKVMSKVDDELDTFTAKMLAKKVEEVLNQIERSRFPMVEFPAPFNIDANAMQTVPIACITDYEHLPETVRYFLSLPAIDEYYGDLATTHHYVNINKYDRDKVVDRATKHSALPNDTPFESLHEAQEWFHDAIETLLYCPSDDRDELKHADVAMDHDYHTNAIGSAQQLLREWGADRAAHIGVMSENENLVIGEHELMSTAHSKDDTNDYWLTLMAFTGLAAHRTQPMEPDDHHPGCCYVSDVSFLHAYAVRAGYDRYGAIAYFDDKYCVCKIFVSHSGSTVTPDSYVAADWEHAKWVWKVSVSTACFLVDNVCHSRFREASGIVRAAQSMLSASHPIRRLLLPFCYGTVYANRVLNEYLKEHALLHRAFAFTYHALTKLVRDAMSNAPKGKSSAYPNRYKFKLMKLKVACMKHIPEEIYPLHDAISSFWTFTLEMVEKYVGSYYEDKKSALAADDELVAFYTALCRVCHVNLQKFGLSKFNLISMLTHFLLNASMWNSHLSSAVSFVYSVNPAFNGLKIHNAADRNSVQSWVEYCAVVLSVGHWRSMCFDGAHRTKGMLRTATDFDETDYIYDTPWSAVVLSDDHIYENKKILNDYFKDKLNEIIVHKNDQLHQKIIAPNRTLNPIFFSASIML
mmetsp:Transcript_27025/g.44346  ORF Transcript_27025/g.44346 Transcript_27025/m.44346 type:complete len:667 (+) Transcript_27025:2212-4212(+)